MNRSTQRVRPLRGRLLRSSTRRPPSVPRHPVESRRGSRNARGEVAGADGSKPSHPRVEAGSGPATGSATGEIPVEPGEALRRVEGLKRPLRLGSSASTPLQGQSVRAAIRVGRTGAVLHQQFASHGDRQLGDLLEGGIRLEPHPRAAPMHLAEESSDSAGRRWCDRDHDFRDDVALRGDDQGHRLQGGPRSRRTPRVDPDRREGSPRAMERSSRRWCDGESPVRIGVPGRTRRRPGEAARRLPPWSHLGGVVRFSVESTWMIHECGVLSVQSTNHRPLMEIGS
jgi:hypothetical protein